MPRMQLKLTTWNINSVRLRIDLVAKFIKAVRPDVLCLQETKCPDDAFPRKRFKRLGYEHIALNGQKGYHGVAVISRLPFDSPTVEGLLRQDRLAPCRRRARREGGPARSAHDPQLLRARRRRRARPGDQSEIRAQARLPRRAARTARTCCPGATSAPSWSAISTSRRSNATSGATRRCSRSSRTRRSNARSSPPRRRPATGSTSRAPSCREPEKLYTWWSYRSPDWAAADKGRRLDHIWVSPALGDRLVGDQGDARTRAAGTRPSDHVPVTVTLDV